MQLALTIAQSLLYIAILFVLLRLIRGPRLMDRIMSLDGLAACVIGIMVIESIKDGSGYFIDIILVFSLINFIGTVAYVLYLYRKYSYIESPDIQREHEDFFCDDNEGLHEKGDCL